MTLILHRVTATVSFLCITIFFLATVLVEIFGTAAAISAVKHLIVWPGLFILIPSVVLTGGSGFLLAKSRNGRLTREKKKRMPLIAANGVLVLIPCAIFLAHWASLGTFDGAFYTVQGIELIAGATNLLLMAMNIRDGLKISGRFRVPVSTNC